MPFRRLDKSILRHNMLLWFLNPFPLSIRTHYKKYQSLGTGGDTKSPQLTTSLSGAAVIESCRISEINVCDKYDIEKFIPMQDVTYYGKFTYRSLDTDLLLSYESNVNSPSPDGRESDCAQDYAD